MLQLQLDRGCFLAGEGRRELILAGKLAERNDNTDRYLESIMDWNDSDTECYQREILRTGEDKYFEAVSPKLQGCKICRLSAA